MDSRSKDTPRRKDLPGQKKFDFVQSELIVKASEELEEDIKKDLDIPDPPEEKIVQLSGSGKLLGILKK